MLKVKIKFRIIITTKTSLTLMFKDQETSTEEGLRTHKTIINAMWISYVIQSPDSVAVFNPASLKLTLFCMFFNNGTHTFAPRTFFPSWMVFHVKFNLQFNL